MSEQTPETLIKECCAWSSPATLLLSDAPILLEARFVQVLPERKVVVFAIKGLGGLDSVDEIRLGQHCAVTFGYQNRPRFFVSVVKDYFDESMSTLMEVALPEKIAIAEVRKALRVPVVEEMLAVDMIIEGEEIHRPRVKNLSLTGMLVVFDKEEDPKLYPLDKVSLRLKLRDQQVSLRGSVQRCEPTAEGCLYGLMFPETSGMAAPPENLRQMVAEVEKSWHNGNA